LIYFALFYTKGIQWIDITNNIIIILLYNRILTIWLVNKKN
jgi:hypothetical protein